jgi:hypothetical protein
VIGVAVSSNDDFGTRATLSYIEDTNLLDRLARADTASAQNAQTHVVLNHDIAGSLVTPAKREFGSGSHRDIVSDHVLFERVPGGGPTAVGQVVTRIALQQEVEDTPTVGDGRRIFRVDDHAVFSRGSTGRLQFVGSIDGHQADPAVPDRRQLGIPTEGGDVDPSSPSRVEDGVTWRNSECAIVDRERCHAFDPV